MFGTHPYTTHRQSCGRLHAIALVWPVAFAILLSVGQSARSQSTQPDWQNQVRRLAEAQDWKRAMDVIAAEQGRHPEDIEVREWRARVLTWSGRISEAEKEWGEIVRIAPKDPDNWLGLATVYQRQGRFEEAQRAMAAALELDPKRADLHLACGRILRAANKPKEARVEFEQALQIEPSNGEAQAAIGSLKGERKHFLQLGVDNDLFNFTDANQGEWIAVRSRWTPQWSTDVGTNFYQRGGTGAGKFIGSVTGRSSHWGALTVGGAAGRDNAVIPRSEAFFELDRGFRVSESGAIRGAEIAYGQHWYWYQDARILALNQTTTIYLPREWSWSLRLTWARSHFSGTGAEWKPSGMTKLSFPLARWTSGGLSGGTFFAVGTENFGQVDQIGSFASQSYGGELRLRFSGRQEIAAYSYYQKRTQGRTQTSFGFTYGIHF